MAEPRARRRRAVRARGAGVPPARDGGAAAAGRARRGREDARPGAGDLLRRGASRSTARSCGARARATSRWRGCRYESGPARPQRLRDRSRVAAMRSGVRWAATIGAAALTLLAAAAPAHARLRWSGCGDVEAECAALRVPLDRSGAVPGAVRLRVARYSPPSRRPTLLYLSGGPGGARRAGVLRRAVRGRRRCRSASTSSPTTSAAPAARACCAAARSSATRACARPRPARTARAAWARGAPSTRRATRSRTSRPCGRRWAWRS